MLSQNQKLTIVKRVRAMFPQPELSAEECVQVCHEVARQFRIAGDVEAGVLAKTSGNRGCWAGQCYSVDIICYPDGEHADILIAAGSNDQAGNAQKGPAQATYNTIEHPVDPSRYRSPSPLVPHPGNGPEPPDPEPPDPPDPPQPPAFRCPQWVPVDLAQAHAEARRWRDLYMNATHNPQHLEPSITDLQLWDWRRWIELWDPADIDAEIIKPGSTVGKPGGTFCKVLPPA